MNKVYFLIVVATIMFVLFVTSIRDFNYFY